MAFSHLLWLKLELTLLFKEDMIIMMLYIEALQKCFFSEMALFHVDQSHVIRISVKGPDSPRPDFFIPNEIIQLVRRVFSFHVEMFVLLDKLKTSLKLKMI